MLTRHKVTSSDETYWSMALEVTKHGAFHIGHLDVDSSESKGLVLLLFLPWGASFPAGARTLGTNAKKPLPAHVGDSLLVLHEGHKAKAARWKVLDESKLLIFRSNSWADSKRSALAFLTCWLPFLGFRLFFYKLPCVIHRTGHWHWDLCIHFV